MTSRSYTTTGGLVFLTAALSFLLADQTRAWSVPAHFARRIEQQHPRGGNPIPRSSISRASALFSSPGPNIPPLAVEGDWAAYVDARYDRVYYFNHVTGESVWSRPTPSFPDVESGDSEARRQRRRAADGNRATSDRGGKPTLYQILNLPPSATRSEIKRSYLELAKTYHPDAVAKRSGDVEEGRRIFNDIARAWMVLSDEGLRRGYDQSLGLNAGGSGGGEVDSPGGHSEEDGQGGGIRDAIIIRKNKFEKNPVYKKKMEMDDGRNKFGRGRVSPLDGGVITPAPPLEIDHEAEAAAAQPPQPQGYYPPPPPPPLTASQATLLAQNAWASAITAEKDSLQRDRELATLRLRDAQNEARRYNAELENYESESRRRNLALLKRREERRRSAERGVVDGMGRAGRTMEERVGLELGRLGGIGGGAGASMSVS